MENASAAREAVFELFQDLDGFSLEDYKPLAEKDEDRNDLIAFVAEAAKANSGEWLPAKSGRYELTLPDAAPMIFSASREEANQEEKLALLGLDHPIIAKMLNDARALSASDIGLRIRSPDGRQGVLSLWRVDSRDGQGRMQNKLVSIACATDGQRLPVWEKRPEDLFQAAPYKSSYQHDSKALFDAARALLQRELLQRGLAGAERTLQEQPSAGWRFTERLWMLFGHELFILFSRCRHADEQ